MTSRGGPHGALRAPGKSVASCAVLTPGRTNASADTPARGNCEALTPGNAVEAAGADDDPDGVEDVVDGLPHGRCGACAAGDDPGCSAGDLLISSGGRGSIVGLVGSLVGRGDSLVGLGGSLVGRVGSPAGLDGSLG